MCYPQTSEPFGALMVFITSSRGVKFGGDLASVAGHVARACISERQPEIAEFHTHLSSQTKYIQTECLVENMKCNDEFASITYCIAYKIREQDTLNTNSACLKFVFDSTVPFHFIGQSVRCRALHYTHSWLSNQPKCQSRHILQIMQRWVDQSRQVKLLRSSERSPQK